MENRLELLESPIDSQENYWRKFKVLCTGYLIKIAQVTKIVLKVAIPVAGVVGIVRVVNNNKIVKRSLLLKKTDDNFVSEKFFISIGKEIEKFVTPVIQELTYWDDWGMLENDKFRNMFQQSFGDFDYKAGNGFPQICLTTKITYHPRYVCCNGSGGDLKSSCKIQKNWNDDKVEIKTCGDFKKTLGKKHEIEFHKYDKNIAYEVPNHVEICLENKEYCLDMPKGFSWQRAIKQRKQEECKNKMKGK